MSDFATIRTIKRRRYQPKEKEYFLIHYLRLPRTMPEAKKAVLARERHRQQLVYAAMHGDDEASGFDRDTGDLISTMHWGEAEGGSWADDILRLHLLPHYPEAQFICLSIFEEPVRAFLEGATYNPKSLVREERIDLGEQPACETWNPDQTLV